MLRPTHTELKYLYEAEFADGSQLLQPEDNVSSLRPTFDAHGHRPSAFYDVLERAKTVPLTQFSLIGDGHRFTVDLQDGHFEIDGIPFQAHHQALLVRSTKKSPLVPIYFRETQLKNSQKFRLNEVGEWELDESDTQEKTVSRYFIGWQTKLDNGENIQQTIAVE